MLQFGEMFARVGYAGVGNENRQRLLKGIVAVGDFPVSLLRLRIAGSQFLRSYAVNVRLAKWLLGARLYSPCGPL